jgi:hypothetical protein
MKTSRYIQALLFMLPFIIGMHGSAQERSQNTGNKSSIKIITETDENGNIIRVDTLRYDEEYYWKSDTIWGDFDFDDGSPMPGFHDTLYYNHFDFEPYFNFKDLRIPPLPDFPPFPDFEFRWDERDSTRRFPDMESFYRSFPMDEFRKAMEEFRMEMDEYIREFYLHRDSIDRIQKRQKKGIEQ